MTLSLIPGQVIWEIQSSEVCCLEEALLAPSCCVDGLDFPPSVRLKDYLTHIYKVTYQSG